MATLIVGEGGLIHPKARLSERCGELTVYCDQEGVAGDGALFKLPRELLVPINAVEWEERTDVLRPGSGPEPLSEIQKELFDLHVALYNATGKMSWVMTQHPRIGLSRHPSVHQAICRVKRDYEQLSRNPAALFIQTRLFRARPPSASADPDSSNTVLMPLLDLLNHHPKGARFRLDDDSLSANIARPAGSAECMVSYGRHKDALDLALHYAYLDENTPLATSAPIEATVAGVGVLRIAGKSMRAVHPLDLPRIEVDADSLTLSHIICDREHPERLRTVLRLAALAVLQRRGRSPPSADQLIADLAEALCAANLALLAELSQVLAPLLPESPCAALLCEAIHRQSKNFRDTVAAVTGKT